MYIYSCIFCCSLKTNYIVCHLVHIHSSKPFNKFYHTLYVRFVVFCAHLLHLCYLPEGYLKDKRPCVKGSFLFCPLLSPQTLKQPRYWGSPNSECQKVG